MDFHTLNYSLATLCFVAFVSFFLGRWSKGGAPHRHQKPIGQATQTKQRRSPTTLSSEAETEIERLLENGRMIAAVRVARKDLGIGLKDAKDLIDQIRHKR